MLFGVVLCVAASVFVSGESAPRGNDVIPEAVIVSYLPESEIQPATYDFLDSQQSIQPVVFCQTNDTREHVVYFDASPLKYPKISFSRRSETVSFFLFSRPPPIFI